jgi:hypothetical protein
MVRAVGAGRVQLDYNHPLAGRTLIYDVSVEKVLEDENEKILNIISMRIPEVDSGKFTLHRTKEELRIDIPEEAFYLSGIQVAKKAISSDLQKYLPDVDSVSFREVFKRTEPKPETPSSSISTDTTPKEEEAMETSGMEKIEPSEASSEDTKPTTPGETTRKKTKPRTVRKHATATGQQRRAMMGSENQR